MITTRQYNEARAQWQALDKERLRLEAKEDVEYDARLVEINDQQFTLMQQISQYRAARKATA